MQGSLGVALKKTPRTGGRKLTLNGFGIIAFHASRPFTQKRLPRTTSRLIDSLKLHQGGKTIIIDDEWNSSSSMKTLSSAPWTGKTTVIKQKEGEMLEAKMTHSGFERLMKPV